MNTSSRYHLFPGRGRSIGIFVTESNNNAAAKIRRQMIVRPQAISYLAVCTMDAMVVS
jgi:hypothetical protein